VPVISAPAGRADADRRRRRPPGGRSVASRSAHGRTA
jgi:hypothetical protein